MITVCYIILLCSVQVSSLNYETKCCYYWCIISLFIFKTTTNSITLIQSITKQTKSKHTWMAIIFQWMAIIFICLVRVDQSVQTCDAGKQQIWHDSFHSRSQINNNWETYYSGNQLDLLPLTYD
eukprot:954823_1